MHRRIAARRGGAVNRYGIECWDSYGQLADRRATDFPAALANVKELRTKYPKASVVVVNLDRCDYDTNGLTEDEQEACDAAGAL